MSMRLPDWIRTKHRPEGLRSTSRLLRRHGLSTVCEEARCPNKSECFSKPTATFMILGSECTRNCGFCSVTKSAPKPPDEYEPLRVALASEEMGLKYIVLTSPTRDDLPDGGAGHFAKTVLEIKKRLPNTTVEVLTPDFRGSIDALKTVLESGPDVFNHNVETVPRLYPVVRPQADYMRSLSLLKEAKRLSPRTKIINTKSGLMVGLGERVEEVLDVMADLREAGCDFLTIGQYLMPAKANLPVVEYLTPEVFEELRVKALGMGFKYAASSPLVRSSMNAEEVYGNVNV